MTTKQAYQAMRAKFPGEKVRVSHAIDNDGESFCVCVGPAHNPTSVWTHGASFEDVISKSNAPSRQERAAKLREEAAELERQAAALAQTTEDGK